MRLGRSTKQGRDELTYNLTCGAARPPPAVMQKLKPYITREYGIAIAVALIAVALGLRAMGILGLTVAFWSGFASCLALEAWAAYYFLIKLEFKTEEKLEAARKVNREVNTFIEEAATVEASANADKGSGTPTKPPSLASLRSTSSASISAPGSSAALEVPATAVTSPKDGAIPVGSSGPVDTRPTLEGLLTIQFVGKKKARNVYHCILRGGMLFCKKRGVSDRKSVNASGTTTAVPTSSSPPLKEGTTAEYKQILLTGAQIRRVEEVEMRGMKFAIEVLHPERKIVYKIDYLYLIAETETDLERWYFALLTCCVPHNGYIDVELNKLLHDRFKYMWRSQETANWLSALWARFHLNVRVSTALREKMINKVALRLSEKIEEKGYQNYIGNLQITDLDFGSRPPTIESAMIQPPDSTGDLIADIWLHYRNGDASMTLSCEVNFKRIMIIPISATVSCKSLSGKLQLRVPPFPAERLSISFYEEPTMDLVIEMAIGEKAGQLKNLILPKIKDIIVSRLKLAIVERFVAPHRKYFRIPGTTQKDPLSDKPVAFAVKTSLKGISNPAPVTVSNLPVHPPVQALLHSSTNSISSDDDFANWSPALSRQGSVHATASREDMIRLSLEASTAHGDASHTYTASSSQLCSTDANGALPPLLHADDDYEVLERTTYVERMSPNQDIRSSTSSMSSSSMGPSSASEASDLEQLGLAPVPSAKSHRRKESTQSQGQNSAEEPRFSTKVKGIFRTYFPKNTPNSPSSSTPHGKP